MRINPMHFPSNRRLFSFLIIACLLSFLYFGWIMRKESILEYTRDSIINTSGCRIPKFHPWDPSVAKLIQAHGPYKCSGYPLFLITAPNGSIVLDRSVTHKLHLAESDIVCSYQAIRREHEKRGSKRETHYKIGPTEPLRFGMNLKEDYVKVNCTLRDAENFEHYFPLVYVKQSIEDVKSSINPPTLRLNVILLAVDSVSKLNFLRHFNHTHSFVKKRLNIFDMKGYTKVGENSFPNLIPLLTGQFYNHYWDSSKRNEMFWDEVDLVWKAYAAKGYRTFYAEDMPEFGTFQYEKRGFYDPPTDYYYRPLALAIRDSELKKKSTNFCLNSQMEMELIYNYMRDFVLGMESRPFFAFAMVSAISHDRLNHAGYVDAPTVRLLEDLWKKGTFNRTVLILFSDHGLRYGPIRETYIGKFEDRMPFLYIHFPKWFLRQHQQISKSLVTNQKRLMTLFDVHATLTNLLDIRQGIPSTLNKSTTLGSSLMSELSENRECSDANISPHWCPCQTYESTLLTETRVVEVAHEIVNEINSRLVLHYESCAFLEIANITDAWITDISDLEWKIWKRKLPIMRYLVTLTVTPGGGMFEGTVDYITVKDVYEVNGISRINMYGKEAECIDVHKLKLFCYCMGNKN